MDDRLHMIARTQVPEPAWTNVVVAWTSIGGLLFAMLAVAVAGLAARAAFRTNDQQARQLRQLENEATDRNADRVREQADRVAIWVSAGLKVWLRNDSGQPIYDVNVEFTHGDQRFVWTKPVVWPGWDDREPLEPLSQRMRGAAEEEAVQEYLHMETALYEAARMDPRQQAPDGPQGIPDDYGPMAADYEAMYRKWSCSGVEITFRDIAGRVWQRDREGRLIEVRR